MKQEHHWDAVCQQRLDPRDSVHFGVLLGVKNDDTLNSLVVEALKQFLENEERLNIKAEELRKRLL